MWSPRMGSSRRPDRRHRAAWATLVIGWLLSSVGCQVEYAGMTLPSGKYMHDDVQYFAPGPDFPWANTQAATQRARMQAQGLETGASGPLVVPTPPGAIPAVQAPFGRPGNINAGGLNVVPQPPPPGGVVPVVPGPGAVPPPDAPPPNAPPAADGGMPAVPPPGAAPGAAMPPQ